MNIKFTPGPWSIARGRIPEVRGSQLVIAGTVGKELGSMQTVCLITPVSTENDIDRANARLIAAAPGMYKLLSEIAADNSRDNVYQFDAAEILKLIDNDQ